MGTVLFRLFGFGVTGKTLARVALGIGVAVLVWLAYSKVNDHFQHIRDLESANATLVKEKAQVEKDRDDAVRINEENVEMWKAEREAFFEASRIASDEAAIAKTREAKSKEIRNAIQSSAPTATAVDPVIRNTLDSLWGQDAASDSQ